MPSSQKQITEIKGEGTIAGQWGRVEHISKQASKQTSTVRESSKCFGGPVIQAVMKFSISRGKQSKHQENNFAAFTILVPLPPEKKSLFRLGIVYTKGPLQIRVKAGRQPCRAHIQETRCNDFCCSKCLSFKTAPVLTNFQM